MAGQDIHFLMNAAKKYEDASKKILEAARKQSEQLAEMARAYRTVIEDLQRGQTEAVRSLKATTEAMEKMAMLPDQQAQSLIDAARLAVSTFEASFDVSRFREAMEIRFPEIVKQTNDRNVYSKLLKRLEEEDEIRVEQRGAGRRATVYAPKEAAM